MDNSHNDGIISQSQNVQEEKCHEKCELMFLEVGETLQNKLSYLRGWLSSLEISGPKTKEKVSTTSWGFPTLW